ncbi:MAG: photosystem I reaction center subunit XII, partial [Moorea sp. SIO3I8]|nr:photosystem I reaction center subunit XII [Moorena sp. SIO3I8]
ISEYLVPYDQLSYTLRQLGKQGDRITSITPA